MRLLFIGLAISFLVSCSKDGGDTTKPVIVINSPTNNQQFSAFSSVTISGTVADNEEIHEVHIEVVNKNNSTAVLHFVDHVDAKSYNITQVFTAMAGVTYRIHVEAHDHVGNSTVVELEVKGI